MAEVAMHLWRCEYGHFLFVAASDKMQWECATCAAGGHLGVRLSRVPGVVTVTVEDK